MLDFTVAPLPADWSDQLPALFARTISAEGISTGRFVRQVLLDPNFREEGALCAFVDGKVVGFCLGFTRQTPLENAPPDYDRGYVTLFAVDPDYRRQGIGAKLFEAMEAMFVREGKASVHIAPYAPGYFIPGVDVNAHAGALAFLKAQGYREVYRPLAMQVDLWDFAPPTWLAGKVQKLAREGVHIEAFRPGLTLPLLDFAKKEFPGDWVRWVREAIAQITQGAPPDRLMVAWDERGESGRPNVLAFSHYLAERFGPIGVAQAERGRALGKALMVATLEAQRAQGLRSSWFLWSEDNTADRLYNEAGFREVRRFALMRKELAQ